MAAKMIHTGERPANQIKRAAPIGIISCLWDSLIDLAVVRQGTAMSATTAGRNPLNIFSTQLLSLNWVKKRAIPRMIRKEGRMGPKAQQMAPGSI